MGQIIDMSATTNTIAMATTTTTTTNDDDQSSSLLKEEEEELLRRREELEVNRARRTKEIRDEIHSMDTPELMRMIFDAQQSRVATYRTYDDGLSDMLTRGNALSYPTLCASVTANFALLSDAINHARDALMCKNGGKGTQYEVHVARLQKEECEKLRLTAAMHLERLRLHENRRGGGGGGGGSRDVECENDDGTTDDATARLLRESVQKLKKEISDCVCRINDIIEELRCIAADDA